MKIDFSGGAGSVTGSSHLLEVAGKKVLLDCGLYQGADAKEHGNDHFPFEASSVDFLILSHGHIDHTGRVPMLYKHGFRGRIILTEPTLDLCRIMLMDSAFIQEQDAERENKKRRRNGKPLVKPIYDSKDASAVLELMEPHPYEELIELYPGMTIRFQHSGHMLGSAFVELMLKEEGRETKLVFSGDVGNHNIPIMKEPVYIKDADAVILESTYGDRLHEAQENENEKLLQIVNDTMKRGGNLIIPSFAVGRTQEIIYVLNEFAEAGRLDPNVRVFVDSPLASAATQVFSKHTAHFDKEAQARMAQGDNVLEFDQLGFTETVDDSKRLNATESGLVIISASGMAEAGRIRHHLKHNLWRPESTILFVGYQAEGTLGRMILEGRKEVKLFGEEVVVAAKIEQLHGLSGHGDQAGLVRFIENMTEKKPKKVFLVHGDRSAQAVLKPLVEAQGTEVIIPDYGSSYDLYSYEMLKPGVPTKTPEKPAEEEESIQAMAGEDTGQKTSKDEVVGQVKPPQTGGSNPVRDELVSALDRMDLDKLSEEEIINRLKSVLGQHRK